MRSKKILTYAGAFFVFLLLIGAFSLCVLKRSPLPLSTAASSGEEWASKTMDFYEAASAKVAQELRRSSFARILLYPEENRSRFQCVSPCNEGLARAISMKLRELSKDSPEVVFWRQPLAMNPIGRSLVRVGTGTSSVGWFKIGPDGTVEPAKDLPQKPALNLVLTIHRVTLSGPRDKFEADFELSAVPGTPPSGAEGGRTVLRESYSGVTAQFFWFVREKCPHWFLWTNLAVLFMLIGFVGWLWDVPFPAVRIGLLCCIVGQIYILILLMLVPITRETLQFFRNQTRIFYLVDVNSEIWFSAAPQEGGKVAPPYFAGRLEKKLRERIVFQKPGELMSFWRWLRSRYSLETLYRSRRFELNRPSVLDEYAFSGREEEAWRYLGAVSRGVSEGGGLLPSAVASVWKEARLIDPYKELSAIPGLAKEAGKAGGPHRDIALVITSACAPCEDDVRAFLESAAASQKEGRNMRVFTVLVPSLPTTGEGGLSRFEDGKAALISLVSDYLIPLNNREFRKEDLSRLLKEGYHLEWSSALFAEPLSLSDPPFRIPNLRSDDKDEWDSPRDLDRLRSEKLTAEPQRVERSCDEIVQMIKTVIGRDFDSKENLVPVHVIGRTPAFWLAVIMAVSCVFGFFAFASQYNAVFLNRFNHDLRMRLGYYAVLPLSILGVLLFIFGVIWRSQNPEVWTDFGDPRWALGAGLSCWLCWVVSPYVHFKAWGINGHKGGGLRGSGAKRWAFLVCLAGMLLVYAAFSCVPEGTTPAPRLFWKFLLTLIAACLPLLGGAASPPGNEWISPAEGYLEWWRHPVRSALVKVLLIIGIIVLFRGAFPAAPYAGRGGYADPAGFISSYHRIVLTVAIVWSIVGLAVILTISERSWRFWIGPAIAVLSTFMLFLGG